MQWLKGRYAGRYGEQIQKEPAAADRDIDNLLKTGRSAPPLLLLKNAASISSLLGPFATR